LSAPADIVCVVAISIAYTSKTRIGGLKIWMLWRLFVRAGGHRLCRFLITRRLKPQLHKQNPPMRVEDLDAVEIICPRRRTSFV
jgi:hypothetical protein